MCTCNRENDSEEYYTAPSEFEMFSPENLRTSTLNEEDFIPEYTSTPRINYQRIVPTSLRHLRRHNLTVGVAIVPQRIDFDAEPNNENNDLEEDMNEEVKETWQQLKNPSQRLTRTSEPRDRETHKLRRTRAPQYPSEYRRQHVPRIVRVTPCGKCLKI